MRGLFRPVVALAVLGMLAACIAAPEEPTTPPAESAEPTESAQPTEPSATSSPETMPLRDPSELAALDTLMMSVDGAEVGCLYHSTDAETYNTGLSRLESLPEPMVGMKFERVGQDRLQFWMLQTLIPVTLVFAGADGVVLETVPMEPCPDFNCTVHGEPDGAAYAIELTEDVTAPAVGSVLTFTAGCG